MPPPTPSGPVKAKYKIRLTNKSRYPYRSPTDTTLSKIDVLEYEKAYQIGGLTVQLYFNFTGDFSAYAASTTNRYGSCYIPYSTSLVPYVDHCLGMATVTIDGATYVSNPIRYNFSLRAIPLVYLWEIDASGTAGDRATIFDIFNASGVRAHTWDRMF